MMSSASALDSLVQNRSAREAISNRFQHFDRSAARIVDLSQDYHIGARK